MRIQVSLTDLSWIDYGDCKPSVESATANKVDYARALVFRGCANADHLTYLIGGEYAALRGEASIADLSEPGGASVLEVFRIRSVDTDL